MTRPPAPELKTSNDTERDPQFVGVVSYFPEPGQYALGPHEYLEHLHQVKSAVHIPVIGSLNGGYSDGIKSDPRGHTRCPNCLRDPAYR
jgi:hypothetical protein